MTTIITDRERAQAAEIERLRADAERYRWLRDRLLCVDFAYDGGDTSVLVFEIPDDTRVSADLDKSIDAAMKGQTS